MGAHNKLEFLGVGAPFPGEVVSIAFSLNVG